jgi:predicted phosphodiesterase
MKDGVLYFNPGTFRGDLFSLWRKTIGILWVDDQIRGEIIRL